MINYDYFFSEKNGSFNFNSVLSIKSIDELRADKIKDEMISIIESQDKELKAISKSGEQIERLFVLKSINASQSISAKGRISQTSITNPKTLGGGDKITVCVKSTTSDFVYILNDIAMSELNISDQLDLMPDGEYNGFKFSKFQSGVYRIESPIGDENIYDLFCYVNGEEDVESIYTYSSYSSSVDESIASNGVSVSINGEVISSSSGDKSSSDLDAIATDIVNGKKFGYSITKEFKNGIDNTDGYLIKILFTLDINKYKMEYSDIDVGYSNDHGTITIE